MMWVCCREKHEDIVRATFDLVQDLAFYLPLERLSLLYQRISTIKESQYDEKTVNFLKSYTLSSMRSLRNTKKNENQKMGNSVTGFFKNKKEVKIDESKYYDISKFWVTFQDSNKVAQKVKDLALNSLIEIIQEINEKEVKEHYLSLALDNIKKGDTFLNSIVFFRKLLGTFALDSQVKYRPNQNIITVSQILAEVSKKCDIFEMIFKNVQLYMTAAIAGRAKKQQSLQAGEKLSQMCFVANVTHEEFIRVIFGMIEYILVNSRLTLSLENVGQMFTMFVKDHVTEYELNQFFMLLMKENENSRSQARRFLLDDKIRNEVFQNIFCNDSLFNCEKVNMHGFECFKKLFLIVNEEERSLEIQRDEKVSVNNLNMLKGIESLWQISIKCQNQKVKDDCKDFLTDLYLKSKTKSNTQKRQITELFTERCFNYFKLHQNKTDYQLNCLRLVRTFMNRFDGEHIYEEDLTQFDEKDIRVLQVIMYPEKASAQVKVHSS
mmetsp:Transcript_8862/g.8233  ORF Transcript_8862/g.8233 Transcript_8862/m.8233 type:complete len:493 (+) Transcript_8862:1431-2909(+)